MLCRTYCEYRIPMLILMFSCFHCFLMFVCLIKNAFISIFLNIV